MNMLQNEYNNILSNLMLNKTKFNYRHKNQFYNKTNKMSLKMFTPSNMIQLRFILFVIYFENH